MPFIPTNVSYSKINFSEDISLAWPFFVSEDTIEATGIIDVAPSIAGLKIKLPDATLTSEGQNLIFKNVSSDVDVDIIHFDSGNVIATLAASQAIRLYLTNNDTQNGEWSVLFYGGDTTSGLISVKIESPNDALIITGGDMSAPSGAANITVSDSLLELSNVSTQGLATFVDGSNLWESRSIDVGSNLTITNADGVSGNPTISLNSALVGLSNFSLGDLDLSTTGISFNDTNITDSEISIGNIELSSSGLDTLIDDIPLSITTSGTGNISLNGIEISTTKDITNINDISVDGNTVIDGNLTVNGDIISSTSETDSWVVFKEVLTGPLSEITIGDSSNVASVTGEAGTYVINFTSAFTNTEYGVLISLGSLGGVLPPPIFHAFYTVKNLDSVTIAVVDSGGEFVNSLPHGMTVFILGTEEV